MDNFSANISGGDFASNWRLNVPEGTENLLQDLPIYCTRD
ncbi:Uncharacterised protein [Vibrio cholerae]|nr:Uncharacterised protein [Vibrio cholerae]